MKAKNLIKLRNWNFKQTFYLACSFKYALLSSKLKLKFVFSIHLK